VAFESVSIRSKRNGVSAVVGYRDDLAQADVVSLELVNGAGVTSCQWLLKGRPEGSNAGGIGPEPVVLANALTASFTVDSDSGAFRTDGTYVVVAVLNPGAPSEVRKTTILARLSGSTVPGPGGGTRTLRKMGGFESLEDTSIPNTAQGWATQLLRWLELARAGGGGGGGSTLQAAYLAGASAPDQTLPLADARGGGVVVDGSGGSFTGVSALKVLTASSGVVAVDRATGRLGVGTASPAKDIHVRSTAPTLRLDDSNGVVFDLQDDASVLSVLQGATTVATFPAAGGMSTAFGVGLGAAAPGSPVLALGDGSAAPVSGAGQGWLRFNPGSGFLEASLSMGAWTPISTGGGGAPSDAHYVTTRAESGLSAERNLGALTSGILKQTVSLSEATISIAVAGTDYQAALSPADATISFPTASTIKVGVLSQPFVVEGAGPDAQLPNAQFTGALATGILKVTTSTGVLSTAVAGTDFQGPLSAADATISFPTATTVKVGVLPEVFVVEGTGPNSQLPNAQFIGNLATGLLKVTTSTGVLSTATAGTDFPSATAFYVVTQSPPALTNATNLGSLTSGVLQQTVTSSAATLSALNMTTGAVPFGASNGTLTQDATRFIYQTATVSSATVSQLLVGSNHSPTNQTNVGTFVWFYNPVTSGTAQVLRLQTANATGTAQIQMVSGAVGGTELPMGTIATSIYGATFGSMDFSTYYNSGVFTSSFAGSFQGGGLRLTGPLWMDTAFVIDSGSPDVRNTPFIHIREGNAPPTAPSHTMRIAFIDGNGTTIPRAKISQNNHAYRGIALWGRATDAASASSFVPSNDGWYQFVTGTTTINCVNYFDVWDEGDILILKCGAGQGPITLTHNGTATLNTFALDLAGGQNVSLAAGDRIGIMRDNSASRWVEVFRSGPSFAPVTAAGLTSGSVLFWGSTGINQDNANFFWDATNHRLGVGTSGPVAPVTIARSDTISSVGVALYLNQASGQAIVKHGGVFTLGTDDSNFMLVNTNGSTRIRIEAAGGISFTAAGEPVPSPTVFYVRNTTTVASGASATLDATLWNTASVSITGGTNITTATGFNGFTVQGPQYNGTVTITSAGTFVVAGAPTISGGGTITNKWSLWVQAGASLFAGDVSANDVIPAGGDATGQLGFSGQRWNQLWVVTAVVGDLALGGDGFAGDWVVREAADSIHIHNRRTRKAYRLPVESFEEVPYDA
jgi:hypothetical protein